MENKNRQKEQLSIMLGIIDVENINIIPLVVKLKMPYPEFKLKWVNASFTEEEFKALQLEFFLYIKYLRKIGKV
jgi:hypothetical protein